eukprot:scaffold113134_cov47-Phaeocystis_antarctica.AAC.2
MTSMSRRCVASGVETQAAARSELVAPGRVGRASGGTARHVGAATHARRRRVAAAAAAAIVTGPLLLAVRLVLRGLAGLVARVAPRDGHVDEQREEVDEEQPRLVRVRGRVRVRVR